MIRLGERLATAVSAALLVVSATILVKTWGPIGPTHVQQVLAATTAGAVFLVLYAVALRWRDRHRFLPWMFPVLVAGALAANVWLRPWLKEMLPLTERADDSLFTAALENPHPMIKKDLAFYYWLRPILDGRELLYTPAGRKRFDLLLIRNASHLVPRPIDALPPFPPERMAALLAGPLERAQMYDGTPVRVALDHSGKQRYVLVEDDGALVFAAEGMLWEPGSLKVAQ